MSLRAITLALETTGLSPSEKLVLIVLANYANEKNQCWPSQKTLAKLTELTDRSIRNCLSSLEQKGLIYRTHQQRSDGSRSSDMIQIIQPEIISAPPERISAPPETVSGHDTSYTLHRTSNSKHSPQTEGEFEEFWKLYPRHEGKALARKAHEKALKKISHADLMANLRRLLPSMGVDPQYAPHAATWLNGERWDDQPVAKTERGRPGLAVVPTQTPADIERRRKADAEWRAHVERSFSNG